MKQKKNLKMTQVPDLVVGSNEITNVSQDQIIHIVGYYSCLAVRNGKKDQGQENNLGNWGRLKVLNDTKLILNY